MQLTIHHHIHADKRTEFLLQQIKNAQRIMSTQLDELQQALANQSAKISALQAGVDAYMAANPASNLKSFIDAANANTAAVEAIISEVTPAPAPADPSA